MIIFDPSHVNHACVPVCPLPVANRGCIVVIMYHNRWRGCDGPTSVAPRIETNVFDCALFDRISGLIQVK